MQYILVQFPDESQGYQEVCRGSVTRYTDLSGSTLVPSSYSCLVVDSSPAQPIWAIPDPPLASSVPAKRLSRLDFMNRFTETELATIYSLAKTNVGIEIWLARFNAATPEPDGTCIDLADIRTMYGIQALEAAGIIGIGRATEILNA